MEEGEKPLWGRKEAPTDQGGRQGTADAKETPSRRQEAAADQGGRPQVSKEEEREAAAAKRRQEASADQ